MTPALTGRCAREIHFTHCIQTAKAEFVPMTNFQPSSPREVVFIISFLNFVAEMIMKLALFSCEISGIDICSDRNLSDLHYANNVVLLSKDSSKLHVFHRPLADCRGQLHSYIRNLFFSVDFSLLFSSRSFTVRRPFFLLSSCWADVVTKSRVCWCKVNGCTN